MTEPITIIGIAGEAESGKDTAASFLVNQRGFTRVALADGVRSAFGDLSGPTGQFYKELNGDFTYRRALQLLGTEARIKARNARLWISLAFAKIVYAATIHPVRRRRFVIPDFRYPREEAAFRAYGMCGDVRFALIRVVRPGHGSIAERHSSETMIDGLTPDITIHNQWDVDRLGEMILRSHDELIGGLFDQIRDSNMAGKKPYQPIEEATADEASIPDDGMVGSFDF